MRHPITRVMFKNDCPMQTLPGSPAGQHSEYHHVATRSLTITYDDATGVIEFRGWGRKRVAHVSSVREMDYLADDFASVCARAAKGLPKEASDDLVAAAAHAAGLEPPPKKAA